jgi:ABC-2 type transport system permease protein
MIIRSSYFILRRMLRGYLGLLLLLVLPFVLISVLGLVTGDAVHEPTGVPMMDYIAIIMILSFQLFGGAYALEFVNGDLFAARRWRMLSLPYSPYVHAFAIVLASTLFTTLQGLLLVLFTQWVHGVHWGNVGYAALVLLPISLLSQLVGIAGLFATRSSNLAERLTEVYGFGSMILAEVWFSLPDIGLWNVIKTYGNPISLGRNAILALATGQHVQRGVLSVSILLAATILLGLLTVYFGRRKLA